MRDIVIQTQTQTPTKVVQHKLTPNVQSASEERLNALTHGTGALLGIIGTTVLIASALSNGDSLDVIAAALYGASLVLLYLVSTVYHALPVGRSKEIFRNCDHMVIYLLIAGSYSVMALTALRGEVGWGLLGAQWGMAVAGISFKSIFGPERFNLASTLSYVIMGWLVLSVFESMLIHMPSSALYLLIAGGAFYTLGVPFFLLDQKYKYFHSIWHLFVMGGSICHFMMAYILVP